MRQQPKVTANTDSTKSTKKHTFVTLYVQGVPEKGKQVFSSYSISTCFKPHQILCQILAVPKDKTKTEEQTGVVYNIPYGGCNKVYVGETKRTVGERIKVFWSSRNGSFVFNQIFVYATLMGVDYKSEKKI